LAASGPGLTGRTELGLGLDKIILRRGGRVLLRADLEELWQYQSVKLVDREGSIVSGDRRNQAIGRFLKDIGLRAAGIPEPQRADKLGIKEAGK
jgi:hypothetical protein